MKMEPNITIDRHTLELNKAYQRIEELEKAIKKHREKMGDRKTFMLEGYRFLCIANEELYKVLEER